jgi:DNA-directed RNA polymerase sigma subunit (sigma70/sigma32)
MVIGLTKNRTFYSTEKNARKDITAKQIANIFFTTEDMIETLEAKALRSIRKSFKHSEALGEYSQDFLASY